MDPGTGRLVVVGVGPAVGYLTPAAARLMRGCEVFVGGDAALAAAPAWGRRIRVAGPLDPLFDRMEESLAEGESVCVLTSGDPGYFGMLAAVERRFPGRAVVEPGVSSSQLLAARLGLPWQELRHVSVHGRALETLEWTGAPLAILCGGDNTPAAVAERLRGAGEAMRVAVGVALGGPGETILVGDLEAVVQATLGSPAVMIVASERWLDQCGHTMEARTTLEAMPLDRAPGPVAGAPGIPDDEFLRIEGVPLSRWEVRAVMAGVARPEQRRVIWDVGAGSGGFAVEMALLAPDARVVAFERDADGCEAVRLNARKFGARVEVLQGEAPGVLRRFTGDTRPDLIVVGGSGGRLEEILDASDRSLDPGGRVVVTAVTLETAGTAARVLSRGPWVRHDALQLATARLDRAGIMRGANPITILWADKENHQ